MRSKGRERWTDLHVHASADTHAVEHVNHVLCGHVASGANGIGTAPEA